MPENELTIYGTVWCADCKRTKQFLGEQRIPYRWVDVDENPESMRYIERVQNGRHNVPTLSFPDGSTLVEPSNAELAAKLGISTKAKSDFYDVIMVGGGPTGLTAALYTAREGLSTLVIDRAGMGGQAAITERLDNFPGFPEGVSGAEFAERLVQQVKRFGVETIAAQDVVGIRKDTEYLVVKTQDGSEYTAHAVLIATGSRYRPLDVPGERELIGSSVHYCATCDGPFYKGQSIAVVGSGNSAVEESIFLTRFASHVTLLARGKELSASQVALEKLRENKALDVLYNTEVVELEGNHKLREVKVRDNVTGAVRDLEPSPDGVFVFVGIMPNTEFLPEEMARDERGFLVTSPELETNMLGVFAAGDVRSGSTKQAASAAGEGATAALMIRNYINKTG